MNFLHKKRIKQSLIFFSVFAVATGLILYSLRANINLYLTPSEVLRNSQLSNKIIRLGGLVEKNTLKYETSGVCLHFSITDQSKRLPVKYCGVLPTLFREGQGVIAIGEYDFATGFLATQILAKHDENYTPLKVPSLPDKKGNIL